MLPSALRASTATSLPISSVGRTRRPTNDPVEVGQRSNYRAPATGHPYLKDAMKAGAMSGIVIDVQGVSKIFASSTHPAPLRYSVPSTWRSARTSSSCCSAAAAAARRRCSTSSPGWSRRASGEVRVAGRPVTGPGRRQGHGVPAERAVSLAHRGRATSCSPRRNRGLDAARRQARGARAARAGRARRRRRQVSGRAVRRHAAARRHRARAGARSGRSC